MSRGILLLNLGTPDDPTSRAVGRYLREFLMDEDIIGLPTPFRWILVHIGIVPRRAPKSAHAYQAIWTKEGSPLSVHHHALARALESRLEIPVVPAMRYGNPSIRAGLDRLKARGCTEVLVAPLYPQYATATTRSTLRAVRALLPESERSSIRVLPPFFAREEYLSVWREKILVSLTRDHIDPIDTLVLSYHGVPLSHLTRLEGCAKTCAVSPECTSGTDECYRAQCIATSRRLAEQLKPHLPQLKVLTTFQSRVGLAQWTQPATDDVLQDLARKGVSRVALASPTFVADCLETLEELGIRSREGFLAAGGSELRLLSCPNTSDTWVKGLSRLLTDAWDAPWTLPPSAR